MQTLAIIAELLIVISIEIKLTQITNHLIHAFNSFFRKKAMYNPADRNKPA
jgi:hypothetical protein